MQQTAFSILDGIRLAAEMEKRGGDFYRLAVRVSPAAEVRTLLTALAEDEAVHLSEFQRLYNREEKRVDRACLNPECAALLSAMAADIAFPGGVVSMAHELDDAAAILREAIHSEQDSIRFYEEMTRATDDAQTVRVFDDIIRQERGHLNRLQKMLAETAGKD